MTDYTTIRDSLTEILETDNAVKGFYIDSSGHLNFGYGIDITVNSHFNGTDNPAINAIIAALSADEGLPLATFTSIKNTLNSYNDSTISAASAENTLNGLIATEFSVGELAADTQVAMDLFYTDTVVPDLQGALSNYNNLTATAQLALQSIDYNSGSGFLGQNIKTDIANSDYASAAYELAFDTASPSDTAYSNRALVSAAEMLGFTPQINASHEITSLTATPDVNNDTIISFMEQVEAADPTSYLSTPSVNAFMSNIISYLASQGFYVPDIPDEVLTGGAGASTFVLTPGDGNDEITNFSTAKADELRFDGGTMLSELSGSVNSNGGLVISYASDSVTLDNFFSTFTPVGVITSNNVSESVYQLNLGLNGQSVPVAVEANGTILGNILLGSYFTAVDGESQFDFGTVGTNNFFDASNITGNMSIAYSITNGLWTATGGDPINDTLSNIQNIIGSMGNDTITGDNVSFTAQSGTAQTGIASVIDGTGNTVTLGSYDTLTVAAASGEMSFQDTINASSGADLTTDTLNFEGQSIAGTVSNGSTDASGRTYALSGTTLTVTDNGDLLTVNNFQNGDYGVTINQQSGTNSFVFPTIAPPPALPVDNGNIPWQQPTLEAFSGNDEYVTQNFLNPSEIQIASGSGNYFYNVIFGSLTGNDNYVIDDAGIGTVAEEFVEGNGNYLYGDGSYFNYIMTTNGNGNYLIAGGANGSGGGGGYDMSAMGNNNYIDAAYAVVTQTGIGANGINISAQGSGEYVFGSNGYSNSISGNYTSSFIEGGNAGDLMSLQATDSYIYDGNGNNYIQDQLSGCYVSVGNGNNIIGDGGGFGGNEIFVGNGNNNISLSSNDTLTLGGGINTVSLSNDDTVYANGIATFLVSQNSTNVIANYNSAADTIGFSDPNITGASITGTRVGNDLLITAADPSTITLSGFFDNFTENTEALNFDFNGSPTTLHVNAEGQIFQYQPPVARLDTVSAQETGNASGNVLVNDSDPNGFLLSTAPKTLTTADGGTVTLDASGNFTYQGLHGYIGSDSFTYTLQDAVGLTTTGTVDISNIFTDRAPVAVNDSYTAAYGQAITGDVLANDSDPDNDPMHVEQSTVTTADGFAIAMNPDGTFSYTPEAGFLGTDSFTYTVADPYGLTSSATVTLDVTAPLDSVVGTAGNDTLRGTRQDHTLFGLDGNDTLIGGPGADTMYGGKGNDTYVVNNSHDVIVENPGEGTDTVLSSVSYALPANVESITLTGHRNINATGNTESNIIIGNSGNNILNDGGESGADTLIGGKGNDTYIVNNSGDQIIESAHGGFDKVLSSVSYTLSANVEELQLTGTADINATGNGQGSILIGNNGNNILNDGGPLPSSHGRDECHDEETGRNIMVGGAGNDTYIVNNRNDVIIEKKNGGTDTVISSIDWRLGENLENLTLSGTGNINATGNCENNVITGNSGNNIIDGEGGSNILTGGAGADTFVMQASKAYHGIDTITDFNAQQGDKLEITGIRNEHSFFNDDHRGWLNECYGGHHATLADYVKITTSGNNSIVSVDANGRGNDFTQIAVLQNVTGLSASALVNSGNLILQ